MNNIANDNIDMGVIERKKDMHMLLKERRKKRK